jgi:hypothetical protein
MSSGAVFQIIANEGRTDRLLLATSLLNQRIQDIQCARSKAGKADCWPTLVDIERTHVLFTNAHFKPYVAMAYEYRRVRVQNGSPAFGTTVTFSIPQIGDFFFDMAVRARFDAAASSAQVTPAQVASTARPTNVLAGDTVDASYVRAPSFPANTVNLAGESFFYRLVDYTGAELAKGGDAANLTAAGLSEPAGAANGGYNNLVRYCEFPGNRLLRLVRFDVNDNPLDSYSDTCSMMYQKFHVPPHKKTGYNRLIGQEIPQDCWSGSALATVERTVDASRVTAAAEMSRYYKQVVNGPQTPRLIQPALEVIHKLQFWFNNDVRLAVPSVSIPYGQRFITMDIAPADSMLFEEPNLFIEETRTTVQRVSVTGTAGVEGTVAGGAASGVNFVGAVNAAGDTEIRYYPYYSPGNVVANIAEFELYINNIFVNPEVHDIYIRRIGFTLIRVHLYANIATNETGDGERQLTQLKWPIEYIFLGIRPRWNVTAANPKQWRDWHRLTKVNTGRYDAQRTSLRVASSEGTAAGSINSWSDYSREPIVRDEYVSTENTVASLRVTAHGVTLYEEYDASFYSTYLPYHYGGMNVTTPEDPGALMVNFALYPGTYQPSGHINVSRAREFNVAWRTPYVTPTSVADLIVVACAINFLLISDGSAVLRFST